MKYLVKKLEIRQSGYQDWITVRAPSLTRPGFFTILAGGRSPAYPADHRQFILNVGNAPYVEAQEIPETSNPERRSARPGSTSPMEATKGGTMDKIQHLLGSRSAVIHRGLRPEGER